MRENPVIYHNHRWVLLESARISPLDRGFLYGDGVFETLRSYDGRIFKLSEHLNRLFRSARLLSIQIPKSAKEIESVVDRLLSKNKIKEGIIRITCSRGPGAIGLDPSLSNRPTFIIMAFPFTPPPENLFKKGISLRIVSTIRNLSEAIPNEIKSSNFLNNILAKIEAKKEGADEAVLLNHKGYLAEGTASNLFYVKKRKIFTPSLESGILEGITRNSIMEVAKNHDIVVIEKKIRPAELQAADECFMTSTGYEIMPATKLNGKPVGNGTPGPMTQRLMILFKESVRLSWEAPIQRY